MNTNLNCSKAASKSQLKVLPDSTVVFVEEEMMETASEDQGLKLYEF